MPTVEINQSTTYVADQAGVDYVVNVKLDPPGLAIDASAPVTGRSFTINGILSTTSGPGIKIGAPSLADSDTYVKIGDVGTFTSGGEGVIALSGGVTFENAGTFTADSTAVEFDGDGNKFTNTSAEDEVGNTTGPGKITSTAGSVLVSFGNRDNIENTGKGTITAQLDAIVSHGNRTSIINDGTAQIRSNAGSAIVASGNRDTIYSVSSISAYLDAIVSSGSSTKITNAGDGKISSDSGRGIVSTGDNATITNQASVSTKLDAIFSSGDDARITNTATLANWGSGAGIRSTGDGASISNTTTIQAVGYGILSSGNNATITNEGTINAARAGIVIAGNHTDLKTTSHIAADSALLISGSGTHVTIENEISGSGKHVAAIEITSTGKTTITNHGAVSASGSGTVIDAGNGAETIVNTASLYGVVNLGGGNDVFKSLKGEVTGAVNAGAGNDRITNTGLMQFDVNLGAGNDVFTSLKGEVDGKVFGGKGNDTYVIGITLDIVEKARGGIDTVESKFTYTLGTNIENLTLIGKGNMEATGNKLANRIEGNAGNNHLTGLGGKDVFVFETGFRQDIVTDFTDHQDRIDFSGYHGISKFSDLRGHIAQSGQDVVITLDGHDRLTLEHTHKSDLSAADFIF